MQDAFLSGLSAAGVTGTQENPQEVTGAGLSEEEKQQVRERLNTALFNSKKTKEEVEVEEAAWESEDSLAAAQRFFSSMALGWGDEMGLWTAAAAASVATGNPIKEVYADMRKQYDAEQERFAQEHSGAAMAADIAGSIASPANLLGAGALGAKAVASMPAAASNLASKVPGLSSARGALSSAAQANVKGAPALLGRATAEGAVYGAGEAKEGERLAGASEGALYGAGGYLGLRGAGKVVSIPLNVATKRRVAKDLVDESGNFIPITLAAESSKGSEGFLHTLYRDVVAPSFGGKGVIRAQESAVIEPVESLIKQQKAFTEQLKDGAKAKVEAIKQSFKYGMQDIAEEEKKLKALLKEESQGKIVPLQEKLGLLKSGKSAEVFAKATADTKKVIEASRFNFRNEAFINSLPDGATSDDVARILKIQSSAERALAVDQLWQQKGYSMLTDRTYRFKANEADKRLKDMILKDEYFRANNVDQAPFMRELNKIQDDIGFFRGKNGRITGKQVAALRARLGSVAAKAVDPQTRRGYYAIQSTIDDMLMEQMPKAAKEAFKRESQKWKSNVILRETVEAANATKGMRGDFTEAEWLSQAFSNSKYDKRYMSGPLVKEALNLESNLSTIEKAVAKRAANIAKRNAHTIEKTMKQHRGKLKSDIERLEADKKTARNRTRVDYEADLEAATNNPRILAAKKELDALEQELAKLSKLSSSKNPSWFHTLAAHNMLSQFGAVGGLGFLAGGPVGAGVATVGAYGLGRGLASQGGQKLLAGQTGAQQNIQRMLQSDITGLTADVLGRAGSKGMFTGQ